MAGTTVSRRLGLRGTRAAAADGPPEGGAAGCEPLVSKEEAAGDVPGGGPEPPAGLVPVTEAAAAALSRARGPPATLLPCSCCSSW